MMLAGLMIDRLVQNGTAALHNDQEMDDDMTR